MKRPATQPTAKAIQYIEGNLDAKLRLASIAQKSGLSEFYFHRKFKQEMGETPNDYISRRRIEAAVLMVINFPTLTITEIAFKHGFSSSANFSKAVTAYFGISPSNIRKPNDNNKPRDGKLLKRYGKTFDITQLYPSRFENKKLWEPKEHGAIVHIEKRPEQHFVGLNQQFPYDAEQVAQGWESLKNWAKSQSIDNINSKLYALAYDNPVITPIHYCRCELMVKTKHRISQPSTMKSIYVPAAVFAVMTYSGSAERAMHSRLGLYTDWIPQQGLLPANHGAIEQYIPGFSQNGHIELKLYVMLA